MDSEKEFIRVVINGKNGYHNYKGEVVIPVEYDHIGRVDKDLFRIIKNKKYGYSNIQHHHVIPLAYDYADHFINDMALVKKDKKWGRITVKAEWLLLCNTMERHHLKGARPK